MTALVHLHMCPCQQVAAHRSRRCGGHSRLLGCCAARIQAGDISIIQRPNRERTANRGRGGRIPAAARCHARCVPKRKGRERGELPARHTLARLSPRRRPVVGSLKNLSVLRICESGMLKNQTAPRELATGRAPSTPIPVQGTGRGWDTIQSARAPLTLRDNDTRTTGHLRATDGLGSVS